MGARGNVERLDGSAHSIAPYLRYRGKTGIRSGLTLSNGKSYRVMLLQGFSSLQVRIFDFDSSFSCVDLTYRNLAEFMREWEVEGD